MAQYFAVGVGAVEAVGARRAGSSAGKDGAMVDVWELPSGETVYVGYKRNPGIEKEIRDTLVKKLRDA
jgi:hypothetical protein